MQWSFSSLSTYEQCPAKYWWEKLSGEERGPPGKAAARGNRVHEALEKVLRGEETQVPKEAINFTDEITAMLEKEPIAEMEMCFSETWEPADWDTSWVRGKLDVVLPEMGLCIDWKTGRLYPKHRDQAELYALFMHEQGIMDDDTVFVEFYYLDQDHVTTWQWDRKQMPLIKERWEARAGKLDEETQWDPRPNQFCNWCNFKDRCPAYGE